MYGKQGYLKGVKRAVDLCTPQLRLEQDAVAMSDTTQARTPHHVDGFFAHCAGFVYQITGDAHYAELARDALLLDSVYSGFTPLWSARAYRFIADSQAISEADKATIRSTLVRTAESHSTLKWGLIPQWNIPLTQVLGTLAIARLFPEHPSAPSWAGIADKIAGDWLKVGDVAEDAINYEPLVLFYIMLYGEYTNSEREILFDRNVRAAAERYLAIVPPVGVMPDYGDSSWGVQWGLWIAVMEKLAAVYRDGRYRWVADRFFAFAEEQHWWDACETIQKTWFDLSALAFAYQWRDDSIASVEPNIGSGVSYRTLFKVNFSPVPEPAPGYRVDWAERREDKLVLRSGWQRDAAYLCLNLQGRVGHDHSDAGAIITYADNGAVLLHDCSYIQRHGEFHNLLFVQSEDAPFARPPWPHSGERFDYKPQMQYLVEFPHMVLTAFQSRGYFGYPITHTRALVFDKRRAPVAIYDRALIHEGSYTIGPLYHVAQVVSKGTQHFTTDQGQPYHHHGIQIESPEARLVIALPLASGPLEQFEQETPPHPFRYAGEKRGLPDALFRSFNNNKVVYQARRAHAGEHVHFLTLLAPLGGQDDPDAWARTIEVLADGATGTCVRYRVGGKVVLVAFRGDGAVSTSALESDAAALHLEQVGAEAMVSFHEATYLTIEGGEVFRTLDWPAEQKEDVSRYFRIPSAISGELQLRPDGGSALIYVYDCYEPGIPVSEVEVGLVLPAAPRRLEVDGQAAPIEWSAETGLLRLVVRGKTTCAWTM